VEACAAESGVWDSLETDHF